MDADLIVVGLGAMGAAVAWQAARRGLSVIGFDRFDPPHDQGSSHAESRITRLAVGEGPEYVAPVARSHEIWRELEAASGERLLHQSGSLIVSPVGGGGLDGRWTDFVAATEAVAGPAGVPFGRLSAAELGDRFPVLRPGEDEVYGLEPSGGVVLAERAVRIQLAAARAVGARLHTDEPVIAAQPNDTSVEVRTATMTVRAPRVVLATGAWMPTFVDDVDRDLLDVTRQAVFWFEVDDLDAFSVDRLPTVIWAGDRIEDYLGIFPIAPGTTPALKVLGEQLHEFTTADTVDRSVSAAEIAAFHERLVAPRLRGVSDRCVRTTVCLYTSTTNEHFLIDRDPRSDRITVVSACSGHGFKHSAAIGEALAQQIAGEAPTVDLSPFARTRFSTA